MSRILVLLVALLTFPALSNAQTIYKEADKFDDNTHFFTKIKQVDIEGGSFFSRTYVFFSLHAFAKSVDKNKPYLLKIEITTPDWVFISSGASLALKFDDSDKLAIVGSGSIGSREVIGAENLSETALYYLTPAELKRIAEAKTVSFRVYGDKKIITGVLSPEFIADATAFSMNAPALLGLPPEIESATPKVDTQPLSVNQPTALTQTKASDAESVEAIKKVAEKHKIVCAKQEYAAFFLKTTCNGNDITIMQEADSTKVTPEQKDLVLKIRSDVEVVTKEYIELLRKINTSSGNSFFKRLADYTESMQAEIDKLNLDLYNGIITWGEYNQRRKETTAKMNLEVKSYSQTAK